jgi:hypothetical protein
MASAPVCDFCGGRGVITEYAGGYRDVTETCGECGGTGVRLDDRDYAERAITNLPPPPETQDHRRSTIVRHECPACGRVLRIGHDTLPDGSHRTGGELRDACPR